MNTSRLLISVVIAASMLSALNLGAAEEGEGYTDVGFIQSLEDLLRSQAGLLSSFEFLMHQTPTNLTDTLMFLDSFEDLLRRQAVLFDGFEAMLKLKWCSMEKEDQQTFLASFEDLLKRQAYLLHRFKLHLKEDWCDFPPESKIKLLASFEDLLRRQCDLFKSYEELFLMKCGGITIEKFVDKPLIDPGEEVTYTYVIHNYYPLAVYDIFVSDDKLGDLTRNLSLEPGESTSFNVTTELYEDTCNLATVMGKTSTGVVVEDQSNLVCVVIRGGGIPEPVQYEQFCEAQKISGTGVVDISTSMVNKKIALVFNEAMVGEGDISLEAERAMSEKAGKLLRPVGEEKEMPLNFYESTKMAYTGLTPLTGVKEISSRKLYGGIDANVNEAFSVSEIERESSGFLATTDVTSGSSNSTEAAALKLKSPAMLVGIDTKNAFNGTWGTDSSWHEIFQKNILAHQRFTGKFEADKLIKLHEKVAPGKEKRGCDGIDC